MPDPAPQVVALVAVHNRLAYTQRCLRALRAAAVNCRLEVILVDDGSTDGTAEWFGQQAPEVHLLRGDGNLWFGGALQWALQEAKARYPECDYILTVNNDTFLRPGAVDEMVCASDRLASVGACFWIEDRQIPGSSGFTWHWLRGPRDFVVSDEFKQLSAVGSRAYRPVDLLATTATLLPARFCFQVEGIDTIHHPHNRADICLTAQVRDAGSPLLVSTYYLADHLYGSMQNRHSVRRLTLRQFLHATFVDRIGPANLPCGMRSIWRIAPSRLQAIPVILMRASLFSRQLLAVTVLNIWRVVCH